MKVIFEDNETVPRLKEWLEAPTQFHMANAALLIANVARSGTSVCVLHLNIDVIIMYIDSNCKSLVKDGFVPLLIALVKQEETEAVSGFNGEGGNLVAFSS